MVGGAWKGLGAGEGRLEGGYGWGFGGVLGYRGVQGVSGL